MVSLSFYLVWGGIVLKINCWGLVDILESLIDVSGYSRFLVDVYGYFRSLANDVRYLILVDLSGFLKFWFRV
jgi:hypothetical protein